MLCPLLVNRECHWALTQHYHFEPIDFLFGLHAPTHRSQCFDPIFAESLLTSEDRDLRHLLHTREESPASWHSWRLIEETLLCLSSGCLVPGMAPPFRCETSKRLLRRVRSRLESRLSGQLWIVSFLRLHCWYRDQIVRLILESLNFAFHRLVLSTNLWRSS